VTCSDYALILRTGNPHPSSVVPRLLAALKFHSPDAFARVQPIVARMPKEAFASEADSWWDTREGDALLAVIFAELDRVTPVSKPAPALGALLPAGMEEVRTCDHCGARSTDDIAGRRDWQMRGVRALRVIDLCPACAG
jgi:hypothetical protein